MKTKEISSSWIYEENVQRMDCSPYLSGGIEIRMLLNKSSLIKNPLLSVTLGHDGGIYNGPHFRRIYVQSKNEGVPFLTSGSIMELDLSNQPLLIKKDAFSPKLAFLEIKTGMTLISCSGTIGKTAYARPDMDGMWSSQDVLKVVADPDKIPSGYLYAYLRSSFGVPMVISGTYGTIIKHLEPEHIYDLPVARIGSDLEIIVHNLIEESAVLRSSGSLKVQEATKKFIMSAGLEKIETEISKKTFRNLGSMQQVSQTSLRAFNYLPNILIFKQFIQEIRQTTSFLGELVISDTLKSGPRFKRIDAYDENAVSLIGQREIFSINPEGRLISKKFIPKNFLIFVPDSTIMIAAQGGIKWFDSFARSQFITGRWCDYAYSQHFIRVIVDKEKISPAVLFSFIRSNIGFALLRGCAVGSMQQDFHPEFISQLPIPLIDEKEMCEIDIMVREAYAGFDLAYEKERQAINMVEQAIKEAT